MDANTNQSEQPAVTGQREWIVALLLSVFVGSFGVDRFYMGLIGTGILKLLTGGGCGIWWLIDVILIATNSLKDKDGQLLKK
jgi:TM2 domain-containing membrane protein YozV